MRRTICTILLLLGIAACDDPGAPSDHDERLERTIEAMAETELIRIDELPGDEQLDEDAIYFTEPVTASEWSEAGEFAPSPSASPCELDGYYQYKAVYEGCQDCWGVAVGDTHTLWRRWCSCNSCGGWEYNGWSCSAWCG